MKGTVVQADGHGKSLDDLKIEKAPVESERRTVEADLGPVRYLARYGVSQR